MRGRHLLILCMLCGILSACNSVRVRKGDTLYSIARRENVPVRALIERNNISPPYHIYPGQRLVIPRQRTYRVKKGDTLYSIAKRNNMTVAELARINNLTAPYTLSVNQQLKLSSWDNTTSTNKATTQNTTKTTTSTTKSSHEEIQISHSGIVIVLAGNKSFKVSVR